MKSERDPATARFWAPFLVLKRSPARSRWPNMMTGLRSLRSCHHHWAMLHYKDKSEGKVHAKVMLVHPAHVHLFHVLVPLLYWGQFTSNWEGPAPGDQNSCDATASTTLSHSLHSLGTCTLVPSWRGCMLWCCTHPAAQWRRPCHMVYCQLWWQGDERVVWEGEEQCEMEQ